MGIKRLIIKTLLFTTLIATPPIWLVTTNKGLNTVLTVASWFAPVESIDYTLAQGKIIGQPVVISGIRVKYLGQDIHIAEAIVDWQYGKLTLNKITGLDSLLPDKKIFAYGLNSTIEKLSFELKFIGNSQHYNVTACGLWQQMPLQANLAATHEAGIWLLQKANLSIANNTLLINQLDNTDYNWQLKLLQPHVIFKNGYGALHGAGTIHNLFTQPSFEAQVSAKDFGFQDYSASKLQLNASLSTTTDPVINLNLTADSFTFNQNIISALNFKTSGTLNAHQIIGHANFNNHKVKITANANYNKNLWQSKSILVQVDQEKLSGYGSFDIAKICGELKLDGTILNLATNIALELINQDNFSANLQLRANSKNYLTANASLIKNKLNARVRLTAEDLSLIMKYVPDITRLKGLLTLDASVTGSINQPQITAEAHLTNVTATLPGLGVKIKPLELHFKNVGQEQIRISGQGKMRRGPGEFTINGHIEPFKAGMPNLLKIIGHGVEFVNTDSAHLIANNQLQLSYDFAKNILNINGHIDILEGKIYFDSKKTSTVKSHDVVFVDTKAKVKKSDLNIVPNLNVRIQEGVEFKGFGLESIISGKLDVYKKHDTMYGNGRITIKQGTYQLPGQKLMIEKGRLLYPPGTLLSNPSLDIKMHSDKKLANAGSSAELELFIRGSAQAPSIHETSINRNTDKVLSQALMAGSSVLSKNILQDKLKLSELGIADSNQGQSTFFSDPTKDKNSIKNKDLVIGRPLGKNFYLQYLQSMGEANKRVRLKYALNDNWALGAESGTQGQGIDLSFAIERD